MMCVLVPGAPGGNPGPHFVLGPCPWERSNTVIVQFGDGGSAPQALTSRPRGKMRTALGISLAGASLWRHKHSRGLAQLPTISMGPTYVLTHVTAMPRELSPIFYQLRF